MGTDVSDFSAKYHKKAEPGDIASTLIMPPSVTVTLHGIKEYEGAEPKDITCVFDKVDYETRYGTNPHQQFVFLKPRGRKTHVGDMKVHKLGKGGFSLTNLQDISEAVNALKYFKDEAGAILKHLVPCGFYSYVGKTSEELIEASYACDPRSAFGGTVAFNRPVDEKAAEKIMKTFFENVVATDYTPGALEILKSTEGTKKLNNSIRVVSIPDMTNLPKFWGDPVIDYLTLKSTPTGELSLEVPYLTAVRSIEDFITDPQVEEVCAIVKPTPQQLADALIAWYVAINVRSNAITIVKNGKAIGIGTGQLDRVGAVENAVDKAKKFGHNLEGAILASDAFFPKEDSIEYAANAGIAGIVWPAGSKGDKGIIAAANNRKLALIVPKSGERCFIHK